MMESFKWEVGQFVQVKSRTWAGINRPGGHGKVVRIHEDEDTGDLKLDVRYTLGGCDKALDPCFVELHKELDPRGRSRRQRALFVPNQKEGASLPKNKNTKRPDQGTENLQNGNLELSPKKSRRRKNLSPTASRGDAEPLRQEGTRSTALTPSKGRKTVEKHKPAKRKLVQNCSTGPATLTPTVPASILLRFDRETPSPLLDLHSPNRYMLPASMRCTQDRLSATPSSFGRSRRSRSRTSPPVQTVKDKTISPTTGGGDIPSRPSPAADVDARSLTSKRIGLREVYDRDLAQASQFIEEVVEGKSPSKQEKLPGTTTPGKLVEVNENCEHFRRTLFEMLESQDGCVSDSDLMTAVNENNKADCAGKFTDAEVESFLQKLCDDNKIMRSDGLIYCI